jgi:hypothetical protein
MHWRGEFCNDQETEWSRKPSRTWTFSTIARATARTSRERESETRSASCHIIAGCPGGHLHIGHKTRRTTPQSWTGTICATRSATCRSTTSRPASVKCKMVCIRESQGYGHYLTQPPAVMNYTEMESKVREATNNEPWGASSSMMQEIASGTHN